MDANILKLAEEWTKSPFDEKTANEVKELINSNNEAELYERFYTQLEFGTGGLRGIIGAGTNRMNIYTVGMTSQGLANYINKFVPTGASIVIARDSRNMSYEFAVEAAVIFAANGIKVYFYEDITPTPLCSYGIRKLNATSGVVVTASHNPPEYNGYKVYWSDGGQIVTPHDNEIIDEVRKITDVSTIKKIDFEEGLKSGTIIKIGDDVIANYIEDLEKYVLREKSESATCIAYTPIHGTGYKIVPKVLKHFGFVNVHPEEAQSVPDGNFTTVKSPNPEEREAFTRALQLAEKVNADIVIGTDPDADRMGIAFKDNTGTYQLITGNQIGSMLAYYILQRKSSAGTLPKNAALIKSMVTTELQTKIANSFSCKAEDVITGFKWIADKMKSYDETGSNTFIFGGEESYGYLPVPFVRDKDAVASAYFFAEMADWLKQQNKTMQDFLNEIYVKFGLFIEDLHSITIKGSEGVAQIKQMMNTIRSNTPLDFAGIKVKIVKDYLTQKLTNLVDASKNTNIPLPASDVLQFILEDESIVTLRPSGTEPKIKFYFSVNTSVSLDNLEESKVLLKDRINALKQALIDKAK